MPLYKVTRTTVVFAYVPNSGEANDEDLVNEAAAKVDCYDDISTVQIKSVKGLTKDEREMGIFTWEEDALPDDVNTVEGYVLFKDSL